jgi:hypothetical protein
MIVTEKKFERFFFRNNNKKMKSCKTDFTQHALRLGSLIKHNMERQ